MSRAEVVCDRTIQKILYGEYTMKTQLRGCAPQQRKKSQSPVKNIKERCENKRPEERERPKDGHKKGTIAVQRHTLHNSAQIHLQILLRALQSLLAHLLPFLSSYKAFQHRQLAIASPSFELQKPSQKPNQKPSQMTSEKPNQRPKNRFIAFCASQRLPGTTVYKDNPVSLEEPENPHHPSNFILYRLIDRLADPTALSAASCLRTTDPVITFPLATAAVAWLDVIDSTRHYNNGPEKMRAAMDAYDELVVGMTHQWGGHLVGEEGDGKCLLFKDYNTAAEFCRALVKRLTEDTQVFFQVRVGIGRGKMRVRVINGCKCIGQAVERAQLVAQSCRGERVCVWRADAVEFGSAVLESPLFCIH